MKKFAIYEPVFGTWFEGRKRLDGVVDLAPANRARSRGRVETIEIVACDAQDALVTAKELGFKAPIISEVDDHVTLRFSQYH